MRHAAPLDESSDAEFRVFGVSEDLIAEEYDGEAVRQRSEEL